jgi:hypothetical protein
MCMVEKQKACRPSKVRVRALVFSANKKNTHKGLKLTILIIIRNWFISFRGFKIAMTKLLFVCVMV